MKGNPTVYVGFPSQRPNDVELWCLIFFTIFNKLLNRQLSCSRSNILVGQTWWRHQMETFSALLALCAGNSPVTYELPTQRPVPRSFNIFVDLRLNKRLSKQWLYWWFETPSRPLWRHYNGLNTIYIKPKQNTSKRKPCAYLLGFILSYTRN